MSVFGGILLFAAGVATGSGLVVANRMNVQRETAQLRRENEHLKNSAWQDLMKYETTKAYSEGFREGRLSPANDAEKFVDFVERNNIDFRGPRRRDRRVQADNG